MASYAFTSSPHAGRSFASRVVTAAHEFTGWVAFRRARHATGVQLSKMSNRELEDIGLSRWDVDRMV